MEFASEHFRRFARYNAWANERLYRACGRLPEAEYLKPRPAFFKSIHGTLNHILVGDRIWLGRFQNRDAGIKALNQQLYGDFLGLHVARQAEDALIIAFIEDLGPADYQREISYRNMRGESFRQPLNLLLAHYFNHQTHHRGQAHDLLSQTAVPPPELDLIFFLRSESQPART